MHVYGFCGAKSKNASRYLPSHGSQAYLFYDPFLDEALRTMDIFPSDPIVKCTDRYILNGHRSGLVWFTGLSGSGKSTLAHAVEARLHKMGVLSYVLDGDNIRRGLN